MFTKILALKTHLYETTQNRQIIQSFGLSSNVEINYISGGGNIKSHLIPWFIVNGERLLIKELKVESDNDARYCINYMIAAKKALKEDVDIPFYITPENNSPENIYRNVNGKYYILEKWAKGKDISTQTASIKTFGYVAQSMAKIHRQSEKDLPDSYLRKENKFLKWLKTATTSDLSKVTQEEQSYIQNIQNYIKTFDLSKLKKIHIIGDLNFANIKFDKNNKPLAIFDWDQCRFGYRIEDFISPIIHTGRPESKRHDNPDRIIDALIEFISSYNKTANEIGLSLISKEELSLIPFVFKVYFTRLKIEFNEETSFHMLQVLDKVFSDNKWKSFLNNFTQEVNEK